MSLQTRQNINPVCAGLYFGALIPLSANHNSQLLLPGIYGLGTALPGIVIAFLIAFASRHVGRIFNKLSQIERWVRTGTGILLIIAGVYMILTHIYGLSIFGLVIPIIWMTARKGSRTYHMNILAEKAHASMQQPYEIFGLFVPFVVKKD